MSQGRTGPVNYRCPQCLLRDVDYDLLYQWDQGQYYCRRCNWEGDEQEIRELYTCYKRRYRAMLERFTVEDLLRTL